MACICAGHHWFLLLCVLLSLSHVTGTITGNAFFIKSPQGFKIDGNASDWNAITTTHPIQDAQGNDLASFRGAYDAGAVYFYVTVLDATPLLNSGNTGTFQQLFYTGDAISICFGPRISVGTNQRIVIGPTSTGGTEIFVMRPTWADTTSHPYSYYTTAFGTYLVNYEWHITDVNTSVVLNKTSTGWSAEIRLPWSVLGYIGVDNDYLPFDLEILSSNAVGNGIVAANWWHSKGGATSTVDIVGQATLYPFVWGFVKLTATDQGPQAPTVSQPDEAFVARGIPITFNVPSSGLAVSVNIIASNSDFIVKDLVRAKIMNKGSVTVYWNGRDRENKPVLGNRSYRARIATFQPLSAKFAASLGNSGKPSYPTTDGKGSLGGVHYGPKYVIAAGDNSDDIFLAASVDEGTDGMRRMNSSFFATWTLGAGIFANVLGIATEGGIYCYCAAAGSTAATLGCYNATNGAYLARTTTIGDSVSDDNSTLVMSGGLIIFGDATAGALRINQYNATSKSWLEQVNIAMPGLTSTCRVDSSNILLVYTTNVYKYNVVTKTKAATPIISGYLALSSCTVDTGGNIYVGETGAKQQVFKHSSTGTISKAYGTQGGRPPRNVPYTPLKFQNISSLAVVNNVLYIVERYVSPFRVAIIDATTGNWIRDFYGPVGYSTNIVDLDDMSRIYYNNPLGPDKHYMETKINYAKFQSNPLDNWNGYSITGIHYLSQNGLDNAVSDKGGVDVMQDWVKAGQGYGAGTMFTGKNGLRYMFMSSNYRTGIAIMLWNANAGIWYPVASITQYKDGWTDKNHDHFVNTTETYTLNVGTNNYSPFTFCDKSLNLYGPTYMIKPSFIDASGVPSYNNSVYISYIDTNNTVPAINYNPAGLTSYSVQGCPSQNTSYFYMACNLGPSLNQGFWDRASDARIMRVQNGTVQWVTGHRNFPMTQTGDIAMLMSIVGELDGVVVIGDIASQFQCYTSDGLTLGWLLKDEVTGQTPVGGPQDISVENAGQATFAKDPITGKRLLTSMTTGDVRVLEVSGPFDQNINRTLVSFQLTNSWPMNAEDDSSVMRKKSYALNYITMGDGSDGAFYANGRQYADGYDFEWTSKVPVMSIFDNTTGSPALVSELRLRRDAGQLGIFAEVLDEPTNFPFFPLSTLVTNTSDLFGIVGVEILIGPAQNSRTTAAAGDTRIFLSATYNEATQLYTGVAFACKPTSVKLTQTAEFRTQDAMGRFVGTAAPTGTLLDFTNLYPIPGSIVAVVPRLDAAGYRLEAYIPLALLKEITSLQTLFFLRSQVSGSPTGSLYQINNDTRSDFTTLPFAFNTAVYRSAKITQPLSVVKGTVVQHRYPWVADGFAGLNAKAMNPSKWGAISRQPQVNAMAVGNAGSTVPLSYLQTLTSYPNGYQWYTGAASQTSVFGGGWYMVNGESKIVTSPPVPGFTLQSLNGAGGPSLVVPWRYAQWDASNLFIPYAQDEVVGELVNAADGQVTPASANLQLTTKIPAGTSAILHILWGQQGGNSWFSSYLNVTDLTSNTLLSGLNPLLSDLSYPATYHQGGTSSKESTFLLSPASGISKINICLTRLWPYINLFSTISAVWVEMYSPLSYKSPATVSLYSLSQAQDSTVQRVSYYNGKQLIGQAAPGQVFAWHDVTTGQYSITAIATDMYQDSPVSSPFTVTVYGPLISSIVPAPSTTITTTTTTIIVQLNKIGSNPVTAVAVTGTGGNGVAFSFSCNSASLTSCSAAKTFSVGKVSFTVKVSDATGAYISQTSNFTIKLARSDPSPIPSGDAIPPGNKTSIGSVISHSLLLFIVSLFLNLYCV